MSRPLHVLLLPSWYPSPGMPWNGIFNQEQAKALSTAGVQVGVAYPDPGHWRNLSLQAIWDGWQRTGLHDEDGVLTYRLHRWYIIRFQLQIRVPAMITAARRYIRQVGRPDILHVHTANFAGFAALSLTREYGIPYLITEHESGYFEQIYSEEFLAKVQPIFDQSAGIICVSSSAGKVLTDMHLVSADKLTIIPNMVDADFFSPPSLPPQPSPLRFLSIGALESRKRVDWILRAFAQAFLKEEAVHLEIGGDGPERAALEALTRELGIADRVTFLGSLSREQVRDAMRRAHAFVVASQFETFGVVLIEALATGIPVISTACGGPNDIVSPEVGQLVPVDDFAALTLALRAMQSSYHRYNTEVIREHTIRRFAAPTVSSQIIDLYGRIRQAGQTRKS